MKKTSRLAARAGLVSLAGLLSPLAVALPAQAAAYDGQSAYASGCYRDARDVYGPYWLLYKGRPYYSPRDARVHLLYSPRCRTVWATIDHAWASDGDQAGCYLNVHRNSDGAQLTTRVARGSTNAYTRMLNDANVTSFASAWCDTSVGRIFSRNTPPY